MKETIKEAFTPEKKKQVPWRRVWIGVVLVFVVSGCVLVGTISYANSYEDRVLPGLSLGSMPIGSMEKEELKRFLLDMNDKLINEGWEVVVKTDDGEKTGVIYPVEVTETNSVELASIDVEYEVGRLLSYGKEGNVFSRAVRILQARLGGEELRLTSVDTRDERITATFEEYVSEYETPKRNADIVINGIDPLDISFVSSSVGIAYDHDHVIPTISDAWSALEVPTIVMEPKIDAPTLHEIDVRPLADKLSDIFAVGDMTLTFVEPHTTRERNWTISLDTLASWMHATKVEDSIVFALDKDVVQTYLEEEIAPAVTIEAQDAKFDIDASGKVQAFQTSRPGITLDVEKTYEALNTAMMARMQQEEEAPTQVSIVVEEIEPNTTTGEVNDLGITEALGVGLSSYAGSPPNRIKNIRNAVQKLNGILIPPGEEFSTIDYTKPYTIDGGYLPELVIKGDEIKPEIGGGLCQIGTTLFRMAMNSGMEITERRNHSLVVNYYNDLTNGLPGTDATIYDPAPDFRFKNDTDHHILVQASMDEAKQDLIFTLWGTSDGRSASYTPPTVSRWIPYGKTRIIETTKLAPGQRECQHAYRGADASFTYTRTLPDGTVEERVFESHYRPLPEICLVGVDPDADKVCEEGEECEDKEVSENPEETAEENVQDENSTDTPVADDSVDESEDTQIVSMWFFEAQSTV